jgi:hypothetical protein
MAEFFLFSGAKLNRNAQRIANCNAKQGGFD